MFTSHLLFAHCAAPAPVRMLGMYIRSPIECIFPPKYVKAAWREALSQLPPYARRDAATGIKAALASGMNPRSAIQFSRA